MGSGTTAPTPPADFGQQAPPPAMEAFSEPRAERSPRAERPPRTVTSPKRPPKTKPRPAASRSSRSVARIAAPVVFLVAVIALIGIAVSSGVLGGGDEPATSPTTKATTTKSGSKATKKYVIKSGDSLSSIATRFDTTTARLIELNPDLGPSSTLVVGERIVVPK